jgi:hypothetical protein
MYSEWEWLASSILVVSAIKVVLFLYKKAIAHAVQLAHAWNYGT